MEDTDNVDVMIDILSGIAEKIAHLLERSGRRGRTVTLKVKYFDFVQVTRSVTVDEPPTGSTEIMRYVSELLGSTEAGEKKVRLLGISISSFTDETKEATKRANPLQLSLPFME